MTFARPYRGLLLLAFVAALVEAAGSSAFLMLMKPITNETFVSRNMQVAAWLPAAIIGLFLVRGIAGYLTDMSMGRAARSIARDLRVKVLGKYLRLPGSRFDAEPVPSMLVRLGSDSDQVSQAAVDALKTMIQQSLQAVGALLVMLATSWQVTISVLLLAPPLAFVMNKVARRYRRVSHRIQESGAQLLQSADQTLSNQQEVKVYGAQEEEMRRYRELADNNLRLAMKVESTRGLSSATVQMMGAIGLAGLLLLAGHEASLGRLTAGDFVRLMVSMIGIIPALKNLTSVQNVLQRGVASAERLFSVLDAPDEVDAGTRPLVRAQGTIEFRDVTARYPGQLRPALEHISFIARPGTVTAIVGRSGSGKSSLIKLIPRFYDVESGQILIDGAPVQDYRLADLRRQIALVGQQVMLFDGTVEANVAYGEMRSADPQALDKALRDAHAMEFVEQLEHGKDTAIGVKGGKLSGGQRQRLAIARAMLKDAPILILDEATAALDNESERLVQDALTQLMPHRTTLVIAHRLSTIEHADQVLVLDHGRLVEQGTHAELLARGGLYAQLHGAQFREAE
ncbi:lipid A export permease/ATP-binding protein MsbA [Pseudoxanthomonas winnipegensis]|uniref:Lipid A export permease/ATP-binding protein MsbA n=1 Tax=Pseudoxanthomonas winnipegensis TaxID=2480810 RepID=A0A4Q8LF65_9GAMM|nr:lipid A export permease/ATP-binding protein MsbA [Pseudoxanthomonas winnipegensis]TAA27856.1 lipid A export permease/ATP-binding protein MsbA [Pseudoxanthomonas winnipegensis]TAA42323.1 lipid A export permease/ATP-binding protein MsbA [Pseudoxanthomonas winnipegensis]TBV69590.1 lipid A export permease/ATP-binding protein MsbA [Pseudoxanthomonas winnipegensis]